MYSSSVRGIQLLANVKSVEKRVKYPVHLLFARPSQVPIFPLTLNTHENECMTVRWIKEVHDRIDLGRLPDRQPTIVQIESYVCQCVQIPLAENTHINKSLLMRVLFLALLVATVGFVR